MNNLLTSMLILFATASFAFACGSATKDSTTKATGVTIPDYIEERFQGRHSFTVEGLQRYEGDPLSEFFNKVSGANYYTITIEPPIGMMDGLSHRIYINRDDGTYWVLRTGGFAGIFEIYGPGKEPAEEAGVDIPVNVPEKSKDPLTIITKSPDVCPARCAKE